MSNNYPTPEQLPPFIFDPKTGWSDNPYTNYLERNTGGFQTINPATVGQAYGVSNPSLSSGFQSPTGDYYTPNYVATPTYNGTPQGSMGSLGSALSGIGNKFKRVVGLGVDGVSQVGDTVKDSVNTAGANASTAWDKMSYGERGTAMLGAATGLYGAYNAHKTGKLAREQFNFTKDSFNRNFEATAKTTNAQLADRQNARHTRNPKAHASVSDYMKKYGV